MKTGFTEINNALHADAVPLAAIAAEVGTPAYIYSAGKIREKATRLQTALHGVGLDPLITFACKANSNIAVLSVMGSLGLGADIVSGGELARARRAGIAPQKIVFSGVGKTDDEIMAALTAGILQINVESAPELERIAMLAQKAGKIAPVAFRVNPDVDAGTHAKITTGKGENKFGIPGPEVVALYEKAAAHPHLHPRGFSMHIGSQLTDITPFHKAFEKLAALAQSMKTPVESIDLGGGLGVIYKDEQEPDLDGYARIVKDTVGSLNAQIILEPGRFLVGDAGALLTKVVYVKTGPTRQYLILDAGMNDLMRPALYEAWHTVRPVENAQDRTTVTYDIVGPVCETGDTFAKAREMPEMKAGELAAIMTGGAYGFVMASNYNTRALPAEVLVDGDKYAIIRARETIDDIMDRETIPEWLERKSARSARA